MKKLSSVLLAVLMASGSLWAGKILTYVGYSEVSQEDADNAAYAGLAKQISADVKVDERMSEKETTVGNSSYYSGNFSSSNKLQSNVKLTGVKVKTLPQEGKRYKSEASVDLDEMMAGTRTELLEIIDRLKNGEARGWKALQERQYLVASSAWEDAAKALVDYYEKLEVLKLAGPIDSTFKITHNLVQLENRLISALSSVTIKISSQEYILNKPEVQFDVYVSDAYGPLPDFPIQVLQGRYKLTERRTANNGVASLYVSKLSGNSRGLCRINVRAAGFQKKLTKASGLEQGRTLDFKLKLPEKPKSSSSQSSGRYDSRYKFD